MRRPLLVVALVLAAAAVAAIADAAGERGLIGPKLGIQASGRLLRPVGKRTRLGNLPTGAALTPDGRFLWTLSTGRARNDVRIVSVAPRGRCRRGRRGRACRKRLARRVGRVIQVIPMPGLSGGVAMAPDGRTAYVSGVPDSEHKDQQVAASVPGRKGDVVHVLHVDPRSGRATRAGTIGVPPPRNAPVPQTFPPTDFTRRSWPRDLAVSPDGRTLLVALNLADHAAVIDVRSRRVRYVATGSYPYGAAITRDGRRGLVSNEADGTVSVIDLASARRLKNIQVGPRLSHPEAIALDPALPRAYVAVTNQDLLAVVDLDRLRVERTLSVARPQGLGTSPVSVFATRDGCFLMSADSGEDAVAVFALPRAGGRTCRNDGRRRGRFVPARPWELVGRIPVGSYPTAALATPRRKTLVWMDAKGLGVGPNPRGPVPTSPLDSDDHINSFQYLPSLVTGESGILAFPTDRTLRRLTPRADRQIRPVNTESPPAGTPIRPPGPGQKLKYVFYIVKENRTYDQVLGDDPRGDADPKLTLFGQRITPNTHALVRRFPLLDHVYANSEASIDGHFWTSAGAVSDYVVKNWNQNYAGRERPYDFGVYAVTWPSARFLFDRAQKDGVRYFNYGEAIAGTVPLTDKDRRAKEEGEVLQKFLHSDLGVGGCFPNDDSSGGIDSVLGALGTPKVPIFDSSKPGGAPPVSESRFDCFKNHFKLQLLTGTVPAFNYITLTNDHTAGTAPGRRTPFAMVADNDLATGQIVDLISHSPIWKQSLIMVVEDDSQDGADHVDAHRIPAAVISPYAKRGAVVATRYDFLSFIRTLEIVVGMKPMNLFDATAVPMYDAFTPNPDNSEPYDAQPPNVSLLQMNPDRGPTARYTRGLNLDNPDQVPQRVLDSILWRYVHGPHAQPPPPGPNASGRDDEGVEREP